MAAGCIFKAKFVSPGSKAYKGYIDYIDRDEATGSMAGKEYEVSAGYANYMENPEKSTGLFTATEDRLDTTKKASAKEIFKKAGKKGGIMQQLFTSSTSHRLGIR